MIYRLISVLIIEASVAPIFTHQSFGIWLLGGLYIRNLYTVYTKCHNRRSEAIIYVYNAVHRSVHTIGFVHVIGVHEIVHEILMGISCTPKTYRS